MAIFQTGGYQVKPSAVEKVKKAIKEFVPYVQESEPGTEMYLAWQQESDPTRFLHFFIFADAAAQTRHGQSAAVNRFESVYSPELAGGDVVFTDYEMVAGKRDSFGKTGQIRHQIVIEARPEKVFPSVATGAGFQEWWAADVTKSDKTAELGFFKRATVYRLERTRVCEAREAEWRCTSGKEWEGTRILFDLKEDKGKTVVRFTHAGWKAETDYFVSCTTTWGELMFRLKAAAEGKKPGPLFSAEGMAY